MKILVVTSGYPRDESDLSGIFVKRLAKAMARSGAKVTVLAPGDRYAKARESSRGINVVRFTYAPRCLMRIGYGDGGIPENLRHSPWLYVILPFFLFSLAVYTIVLASDCEVIHANWLGIGLFTLPARRITKKPLVVTLRGSDLRKGASKLLSFVVSRSDAITTVNKIWAEDLTKGFGCNAFYTPNGVEIAEKTISPRPELGISDDEIIALYVGVLQERKGTDVLAEAARISAGLNRSLRFLVIGPGDATKFGLTGLPNVICTGGIPPHEALAVYHHCDILVLPSRFEGRPNVLLEAMASGLPSVATRLPGVCEVLTDDCGILIDTEDPSALAEGICMLAKDPARRKAMGERARARIKELSLDWESSAREYLRIFEKVHSCAA